MSVNQTDILDLAPEKDAITLRAPAKINLSLVVLAPRPDGYHDLHSLMGTVDLFDDLRIRRTDSGGIRLGCSGIPSPDGPENLVVKAAKRLAEQIGREPQLEITLHKRIPAGGGLGGASSDAAATLVGLNRLWQAGLSVKELHHLAAGLGSDVPFFLYAPLALCTGRGEIVRPLPSRCRRALLLIFPSVSVSTAAVYHEYDYEHHRAEEQLAQIRDRLDAGDIDGLLELNINSLAPVTARLFPEIAAVRERLAQAGIGPVHQSGSGSTLFVMGSPGQVAAWGQLLRELSLPAATARFLTSNRMANFSAEVLHANLGNQG